MQKYISIEKDFIINYENLQKYQPKLYKVNFDLQKEKDKWNMIIFVYKIKMISARSYYLYDTNWKYLDIYFHPYSIPCKYIPTLERNNKQFCIICNGDYGERKFYAYICSTKKELLNIIKQYLLKFETDKNNLISLYSDVKHKLHQNINFTVGNYDY